MGAKSSKKSNRWTDEEVHALVVGKERYSGQSSLVSKIKDDPVLSIILKDRSIAQMRSKMSRMAKTSTTSTPTTSVIPNEDSVSIPVQPVVPVQPEMPVQPDVVIEQVDSIEVEKCKYRSNLEERCNETASLLNQMQSLEEWRSVTVHGRFKTSVILDSYLHTDKWDTLRSDILDAISDSAFLKEETTKISKVATSVRSKLYTKKEV